MDNNDVVIINLDRPRELKLRHKTLKRFLAKTNTSVDDLDTSLQSYETLTALLFEMLHADDPTLTPEACDDLLDSIPLGVVIGKASEAINAAFDVLGENPIKTGTPVPENSTGENS